MNNTDTSYFVWQGIFSLLLVQKHFGPEVMDHTVVVLTHADVVFDKRSLKDHIAFLPDEEQRRKDSKEPGAKNFKTFLKDEICEHVMAVNNNYEREYEREKQRDALVELIDVILLKNGGICFKNKYFDKAEEKLREREEQEEQLRNDLVNRELTEWHRANNRARHIADGISDAHLRELQWKGMEKERSRPTGDIISSIEAKFSDMRKALGVLLMFDEADPNEPLNNITHETVVKCALSRIRHLADQKRHEETERETQQEQEHEQEKEAIRKKNEAQRLIYRILKVYPLILQYRERQAMLQRHKEESMTEKQKYEQMMDDIRDITKSLFERQREINEITKDEKTCFGEHISREGCAMEDFELALGYARETAVIIVEEHFKAMELPQLKDPGEKIISTIRKEVKNHLTAMIQMLEKMIEFDTAMGADHNISYIIVDEAFHKLFPLMKIDVVLEDETNSKAMRLDWQERALKTTEEETKKRRPPVREMSLNHYETATAYVRLLALHKADEIVDYMTTDEITRRFDDVTSGGIHGENDEDAVQKDPLSAEGIQLSEANVYGDKEATSTTDHLFKKAEDKIKFLLERSDEGKRILKLLGNMGSWKGELTLQMIAKESLTEVMFFKLMEMGNTPNLAQVRRTHRMKLLASGFNWLSRADHVTEAQKYDLVKLYLIHAAEFLVEAHLRLVRAKEIKQEDSRNFTDSIRVVTEKMKQDLARNSVETIQYFKRYITPEGKLNSIEKIAMHSVQKIGRTAIIDLETDMSNKLRLEHLFNDWVSNVKDEENDRRNFIEDQIDILTDKIKNLAPEYAKSKTAAELREMARTDYKQAVQALTAEVKKELSDEAKQFFSDDTIGAAIENYAKLNYDTLMKLKPGEICFPADATVIKENQGELKMSELRVGDRILTAHTNGQLIYEDVFMFGKYSITSFLRSVSLTAGCWLLI